MRTAELIAFTVYNSIFTVASLAMLVAFFLKRNTFSLKVRSPPVVLVQLVSQLTIATTWSASLAVPPTSPAVKCVIRLLVGGISSNAIILLGVRLALLFRRFYLGSLFKEQRAKLRQGSTVSLTSPAEVRGNRDFRDLSKALTYSWGYRVVKFCVLVFYAFAVLAIWGVVIETYFILGPNCGDAPEIFSPLLGAVIAINAVLMVTMGWKMRHFHDNFKIGLEFKRVAYFITMTGAAFLVLLVLGQDMPIQFLIFWVQGLIFICGFVPLYEQRTLERKIAKGDFVAHERFDSLMQDPAALEAFRKFLRQEFTEEVLEFYEAVDEYQRMYALWTPIEQLQRANVMYASYLAPDAPSQINISSKDAMTITRELCLSNDIPVPDGEHSVASHTMTEAAKKISQSQSGRKRSTCFVGSTVFDRAQREMRKLMISGPFTRFQVKCAKSKPKVEGGSGFEFLRKSFAKVIPVERRVLGKHPTDA